MIGTVEPLDEAYDRLTPRLSAAGFELAELVSSEGAAPAWVEYRHRQDGATYLLTLTTTSESGLLAEFWRAPTDGHSLEVLEQAEWHASPGGAGVLLSAVVRELERWLERFTDQRRSAPSG
jgi:hypothetical protein